MRKAQRHQVIKEVIRQESIHTQEELLGRLKQLGVDATQATISRDIRDLKIVKTPDLKGENHFVLFQEQVVPDEGNQEENLNQLIQEHVTKVDTAQFLTILHTLPNNAQLLAAALDDYTLAQKVATLAGYDTIVIITKSVTDAQDLADFFLSRL